MGLTLGAVDQVMNCLVMAGYEEETVEEVTTGYIWSRLSADNGATWTTAVKVAAADEEQPSVRILASGEIFITLTASSIVKSYVSKDYGLTWSAA